MKTLIKKSLLVVAVLATTLTIANEDRTFSVNANAEKTTVSINDVEEGQQLSIIDQNNIVIYKETINKNGNYNKTFDLTALPNGDYYFELEKTLKVHTICLLYTSDAADERHSVSQGGSRDVPQ